jgi:hypothetical protein
MGKKRLSTMARLDMVITIHLKLVNHSEQDMVVTPQKTNSVLSTGLVRISGLVPVVQRLHAPRTESVRSNMPKDACYKKVMSRYKKHSAYASGAMVKCRKVGAANWGNKKKGKK